MTIEQALEWLEAEAKNEDMKAFELETKARAGRQSAEVIRSAARKIEAQHDRDQQRGKIPLAIPIGNP